MSKSTPIEAYYDFFRSFNTRDPHVFAMSLHYPHVRMSWIQDPRIFADAEAHSLNQSWDRLVEAGWDHSVGVEPSVIHESPDKVHIEGGWTRVREDGSQLLVNRVSYIVTRLDGLWGIQCRFGMDDGTDTAEPLDDPLRAVGRIVDADSTDQIWQMIDAPLFTIEPGRIEKASTVSQLAWRKPSGASTSVVQCSANAATVAALGSGTSALIYLVKKESWMLKAVSWI